MLTRSQTTTLSQIVCELLFYSLVIFQKYESSRWYFLKELLSVNGLSNVGA